MSGEAGCQTRSEPRGAGRLRRVRWLVVLAVLALVAAACGDDDDTGGGGASGDGGGETRRIAFFAASSQNGFNAAVFEGIEDRAAEVGGIDAQIFDGEFDAEVQFNQIQDAVAQDEFDGFVILANDTVGVAAAVQEAVDAGIPTVATMFPIGPDLTTLSPQVAGLTSTVAAPPAVGARQQAEAVAEHCADIDPCRVVIMIGQLQFPFDNLRYETYQEVLGEHDNIEIVATGEGNYDRDQSLTEMQDILQSNPEVDVVLSNADQHLFGAEIALNDAGVDVESVYLMGGGAAREAVAKVRAGTWDATHADFPFTTGQLAVDQLTAAFNGDEVQAEVNTDDEAPVPPILTTDLLNEEYPDFEGEFDA
jgi:ribose transport system substrate-binding protein